MKALRQAFADYGILPEDPTRLSLDFKQEIVTKVLSDLGFRLFLLSEVMANEEQRGMGWTTAVVAPKSSEHLRWFAPGAPDWVITDGKDRDKTQYVKVAGWQTEDVINTMFQVLRELPAKRMLFANVGLISRGEKQIDALNERALRIL